MNLQWVGRCLRSIVADKAPQLIGLLMWTLEEIFEQPELVHHLERRGMDGVAAEVAQEIGMLLEHQDVDAGAGEEEAKHHPGRSAAGDRAMRNDGLVCHLASTHHVETCAEAILHPLVLARIL